MSQPEGIIKPVELDPEKLENYDLLFSKEQIENGVRNLAKQISKDYKDKSLIIVGVLDGAVFFLTDLEQALDLDPASVRTEFIGVSSYDKTTSTEKPVITKRLKRGVTGQHVLLVEDVLDTGITLDYLQKRLLRGRPASLRTALLVSKVQEVRKVDVPIDYVIFENVKGWLTGYGFDVDGKFRNLPNIYVKRDTK